MTTREMIRTLCKSCAIHRYFVAVKLNVAILTMRGVVVVEDMVVNACVWSNGVMMEEMVVVKRRQK